MSKAGLPGSRSWLRRLTGHTMHRPHRQLAAALLAGVAAFALVAAPVLHAEVHVFEAGARERSRAQAFDRVFSLVFDGRHDAPLRAELARALDTVLDGEEAPPHVHGPGEAPHEHGPAAPHHSHGPGPHGAGSLQHFAAALHVAPPLPEPAEPAALAARVLEQPAVLFASRIFLLVEQSQGPPRA
jgi:hypothetical protein